MTRSGLRPMLIPPSSLPRRHIPWLLVFFLCSFAWACLAGDAAPAAEEPAVSPEINAYYQDPDVERWQRVFESPGREIFRQRFQILKATGVERGMRVADVGAGTGFFTLLFARAVGPEGKVYAVDISKGFLEAIERRAVEEYRVDNVVTLLNDQKGADLPPDSLDLVFICDTYHHFEYPKAMLASLSRSLREQGDLVLIDFRRLQGVSSSWVMGHVRASRDEVVAELEEAGFLLVEEQDFLRENYFLRFRKGPRDAGSP